MVGEGCGAVEGEEVEEVEGAEEEDVERWVQTTMMKAHMETIWRLVFHPVLDALLSLIIKTCVSNEYLYFFSVWR